jgi:hypothetical protein
VSRFQSFSHSGKIFSTITPDREDLPREKEDRELKRKSWPGPLTVAEAHIDIWLERELLCMSFEAVNLLLIILLY